MPWVRLQKDKGRKRKEGGKEGKKEGREGGRKEGSLTPVEVGAEAGSYCSILLGL